MNQYSTVSAARLSQAHPDHQLIFRTVLEYYDHSIFCSFRGKEEQNQAFEDGLSELQWPDSAHNKRPSMGIDAGPYFIELKDTDWKDHLAYANFAGYVMLTAKQLYRQGRIRHQLIWGGDWDSDGRTLDQTFRDLPHFELTRRNVWSL